jgi:hypothetical protein
MALDGKARQALIQQYAEGAARLRSALAAVPTEAMTWRPKPGEWSAHEIVWHCADAETNGYARIRFLVAEQEPTLVAYDQDTWAQVFDYHARPIATALAVVDAIRSATTALIRALPDDAWARAGQHSEMGRFTAEQWLEIYGTHLEVHAQQIEANVVAWKAALTR